MVKDDLIRRPRLGVLEQGSIFQGALTQNYEGCETHGIVITARCDLAHGKARAVHYAPIVKFSDWVAEDNRLIVHGRVEAAVMGELKAALSRAGKSQSLLRLCNRDTVLKALAESVREHARAKSLFKELDDIQSLCASRAAYQSYVPAPGKRLRSISRTVIEECIKGKLGSYHFLPRVEPTVDASEGFVVLLGEVGSIPTSLAQAIAQGLDVDSMNEQRLEYAHRALDVERGFLQCVGVLRSPEIEHLLQRFASQFTRIGVQDPDGELLDLLAEDFSKGHECD